MFPASASPPSLEGIFVPSCQSDSFSSFLCPCRYHDMPDVIDFLVLRQCYDEALRRNWQPSKQSQKCLLEMSSADLFNAFCRNIDRLRSLRRFIPVWYCWLMFFFLSLHCYFGDVRGGKVLLFTYMLFPMIHPCGHPHRWVPGFFLFFSRSNTWVWSYSPCHRRQVSLCDRWCLVVWDHHLPGALPAAVPRQSLPVLQSQVRNTHFVGTK